MTQLSLFGLDIDIFPHERDDVRNWLRFGRGRRLLDEFSGTKILNTLRQFDLGIRTQDFFELRNQALGENQFRENLEILGGEYFTPRAFWIENHGMKLSGDLLYRFEVTGTNYQTGEADSAFFSLSSNQELTVDQAEDSLLSLLADEQEFYGIEIDSFTFDTLFVRPGYEGSL